MQQQDKNENCSRVILARRLKKNTSHLSHLAVKTDLFALKYTLSSYFFNMMRKLAITHI